MLTIKVKPKAVEKYRKQVKVARFSRSKGKRGESNVAKMFSDWYGIPESFLPSKSSGAGNRFGQAGDFSVPENFKYVIENKNVESWKFEHLLESEPVRKNMNIFWNFYEQLLEATTDYNKTADKYKLQKKFPMLTFTKNNEAVFVLFPDAIVNKPENTFRLSNKKYGVFWVCLLKDFLEANSKSTLFWSKI